MPAPANSIYQPEAPVRGGNIDSARITELPVATRNPAMLALTLPGVSTNRFGFGVGAFSVNGGRGRSNNFLIDGTENNDISVAGQGFQIKNPAAVQEISAQTSNYDAEFGRAGGAVVNVITKPGGSKFQRSPSQRRAGTSFPHRILQHLQPHAMRRRKHQPVLTGRVRAVGQRLHVASRSIPAAAVRRRRRARDPLYVETHFLESESDLNA